jgi:hypothetical protein
MQRPGRVIVVVFVALAACSAAAHAQNPDPIGTGPRVDVQTDANGMLEVGGSRGADVGLTGENLRGNFGAVSPQSRAAFGAGGAAATASPRPGGLLAPNFDPSLSGGLRAGSAAGAVSPNQPAEVADFVLPRFRGIAAPPQRTGGARLPADSWRYRYFGGRWWYWQTGDTWVYWNGGQWLSYRR